jgi:hypothetical protein
MKMIRVRPGLYRSEKGSATIQRLPAVIGGDKPWLAKWKGFIGQNERRCATLAEARQLVGADTSERRRSAREHEIEEHGRRSRRVS